MNTLRFVSWVAVSSRPQAEKESLPDQRRLNYEFVETISHHYAGYSGVVVADLEVVGSRSIVQLKDAVLAYPDAYGELVRLVQAGAVDAVVCRSRDRLGRTDALIVTLERLCLEHGVIIVPRQSMPATLDIRALRESESAGLLAAIEGHFAHAAVRRIVNEHQRGMIDRVQNRLQFPSSLPWGYTYHYTENGERSVKLDEAASAVIRRILVDLLVTEGLTKGEIINRLNAENCPSPGGKPWSYWMLRRIIEKPERYAGYILLNRESPSGRPFIQVRGEHTPILSEQELQAALSKIKESTLSYSPPFSVLSGVVYCAVTEKPMYAIRNNSRSDLLTFTCWHCLKATRSTHQLSERKALRVARSAVQALLAHANPAAILAELNAERMVRHTNALSAIAQERARLAHREQRLLHAYVHLSDSQAEWFDSEMAGVKSARSELDKRERDEQQAIHDLQNSALSTQQIGALLSLGDRMFDEADPDTLQKWLSSCMRIYANTGGNKDKKVGTTVNRVEFLL